jgi:hypothetical protein
MTGVVPDVVQLCTVLVAHLPEACRITHGLSFEYSHTNAEREPTVRLSVYVSVTVPYQVLTVFWCVASNYTLW